MSNFDTVQAITENLAAALEAEGIRFSTGPYGDDSGIPAGVLPAGSIRYTGEAFEDASAQRPLYIEAGFTVRVVMAPGDRAGLARRQQDWVHRIRGSLSVDALNTGALAASKPVSRVIMGRAGAAANTNTASVTVEVAVRYREA